MDSLPRAPTALAPTLDKKCGERLSSCHTFFFSDVGSSENDRSNSRSDV